MNSEQINEVVSRYLADNPETARRLVQAATDHEKRRLRRESAERRVAECGSAYKELTVAIAVAQAAIDGLKGDLLRLQKRRKAAGVALAEAQGELAALS